MLNMHPLWRLITMPPTRRPAAADVYAAAIARCKAIEKHITDSHVVYMSRL